MTLVDEGFLEGRGSISSEEIALLRSLRLMRLLAFKRICLSSFFSNKVTQLLHSFCYIVTVLITSSNRTEAVTAAAAATVRALIMPIQLLFRLLLWL